MSKEYLIDGEPVDFMEIIRRAKKLGYEGDGGMLLSSEASDVLRQHGHTVGTTKEGEGK